ncbi:hypothetical protein JK359_33355 [Streptomyces actinomycinicus]|uniref:DUF2637 domain-containing protein n=1 Tax=Streptomyces actinomycinicus TaxID=1695166 RepID=A0A937ERJ0_9ACTN|nr:hypothetical protein [Streptomyces actinomycinicus]MBL1086795.1 hypothetical protein [Streptomyces actinomycinicus]
MSSSLADFRTERRQDQELQARQARENKALDVDLELRKEESQFERQMRLRAQELEAERLKAEEARKDKAQKDAAELAKKQAAEAAKLQREKERRKERERDRRLRRERWQQRLDAAPKWLAEHLDLSAALAVMACSIVPALISQASSLSDTGIVDAMGWAGGLLVALLPFMLECSAWAATAGEAKAMKQGRSPWPYRIAVYAFAGLASWVNYLHGRNVGGDRYGVLLGSVPAASSIIPILVWQLVQLGRHIEYRERLRAERNRRRDARATRKTRRKDLPKVWDAAKRLRAIAGFERLSEEDAWTVAYTVFEGAGSEALSDEILALLSAEMLGDLVEAEGRRTVVLEALAEVRFERRRLSETLARRASTEGSEKDAEESVKESAEQSATLPVRVFEASSSGLVTVSEKPRLRTVSPQINQSVPASARTSESAPARTRETTRPRTRKARTASAVRNLSPGARKAASVSAKAYNANENADIEEWIRGELAAGRKVGFKEVADETEKRRQANLPKKKAAELGRPSKTWAYTRISEAKNPVRRSA